nr:LysM peptidoglycan-binding domain-containing protein [Photobacterium galatheae]
MWAYTITESTADKLSEQPRSNQVFKTILLPWRVNDQVCKTQHLFHSATKLSEETFKKIDAAWLDTHASKVDLDAILSAQKEGKVQPFEPQPEEKIHVVRQRETLSEIAEAYELTLAQLLEMNPEYKVGDRKDKIFPGDEVIVSLSEGDDPSQQQKRRQYYMVKTGDTLSGIAQKHGLSVAALKDLNPFYKYGEREHKIFPGDKFIIQETLVAANSMHTVKAKDNEYGRETWGDIADLYGFSAKELCEMNAGYIGNESSLSVGDKLNLSFPELIKDLQKRNTLPAKPIREVNLTDNMIYRFRSALLRYQLAPLNTFALLSNSVILNLKSLIDAPQQTYKLCLARYALDEVAPDTRTLAEKAEAGFEEKVLAGLNPLNQDLLKKYNLKPSRFEGQTVHTLTLRQIREGYVYVYYEPLGQGMETDYPHASMLFEYKKSGEYFERDGAQTPYLPGHFLIGKAYIVFSERQWTERQRSMFSDDPDFRHQATKISGGVYDFMRLLGKPPSEQTVFDDLPQLIADMDAGDANQDDRFASTIMPTKRHVDEKGKPQPFMPVVSNDVLLNTIDEENPQFADILALEDPIAMVEDSLAVTGRYLSEWIDWQEENQDKFNVTKAVTGFCNLQLDASDPLAQELNKDIVKKSKALSIISDNFVSISSTYGDGFNGGTLMTVYERIKIQDRLRDIGVVNNFDTIKYDQQISDKSKWKSRVSLSEANDFLIKCSQKELYFKNRLNNSGLYVIEQLDLIGSDPCLVFFDVKDKVQSEDFIIMTNYWFSVLSPSLNDSSRNRLDEQIDINKPLTHLIGTAAFVGVPTFKPFIVDLIEKVLLGYPNETFNNLADQVESEEKLSAFLTNVNQYSFQNGSADKSALVNIFSKAFEAMQSEELANFDFYKNNVLTPYENMKSVFVNAGTSASSEVKIQWINNWIASSTLKRTMKNWNGKERYRINYAIPMVVNNEISGYGVSISIDNKKKIIENSKHLDDIFSELKVIDEKLKHKSNRAKRITLFVKKEILEIRARRFSNGIISAVEFTDESKQRIAIDKVWNPLNEKIKNVKEKSINVIEEGIPRLLTTTILYLNALAVSEDYNRILRRYNIRDSDIYTLMYRPLWFVESVLRLYQDQYQSAVRSYFYSVKGTAIDDTIRGVRIYNAVSVLSDAGEEVISQKLGKLFLFGLASEISLIIAGGLESYQIFTYDMEKTFGIVKFATGVKLLSTVAMTASGILGLYTLIFEFAAPAFLSSLAFSLAIIGGIVYGVMTALINFMKDDDISAWLKKSCWSDNIWDDIEKYPDTNIGYKKSLEDLRKLNNQPVIYTQPTLTAPGELDEDNVDGNWFLIELPQTLKRKKVRIDMLVYHDNDELKEAEKDYRFYHIDSISMNSEKLWLQAEWIQGFRPTKILSQGDQLVSSIPGGKDQDFKLDSWQETDRTQLLKFWLPRIWKPSGVWGYQTCPAILLVWYENDLDLKTGIPLSNAIPHSFGLDLSLETSIYKDDCLSDSFRVVKAMLSEEKEDFPAYDKAVSLARSVSKPKLLYVGYEIDEHE